MDAAPLLLDVASYFLNELKIFHTIIYQDEIRKIFKELESLYDLRKHQNRKYGVKKYLDSYHRLVIVYTAPVVFLLFAIAITIVPYFLYGVMDLPVLYWYPFDPYQPQIYPFAYIWINWVAFTVLITLLGADTLLYALITVISMEFDILKHDFLNISDFLEKDYSKRLQILVDRHNKLLNLSGRLEEIYSVTFFFSFVISSLIMCFLAFQLSRNTDNFSMFAFYFFYFWMMGAQILLLCVFGQKLINSSQSVTEGLYYCGWEGIKDITFKKKLVLIILRSQKVQRLSAMSFADISVETFTRILATTGSYFSLLRSVNAA